MRCVAIPTSLPSAHAIPPNLEGWFLFAMVLWNFQYSFLPHFWGVLAAHQGGVLKKVMHFTRFFGLT